MVDTLSQDELNKLFSKISKIVSDELLWDFDKKKPSNEQDFNYLIVSDSIIIWTDKPTLKSFYNIILSLNLIFFNCFKISVPLRGALVYGPLALFNRKIQTGGIHVESSLIGKS